MASIGEAIIDFGAGGGSASVAVTGQTGILATSLADAWIQGATTTDHSADEHMIENIRVRCGIPTAGTGFTIHAEVTLGRARGQYKVKWVWA